MNVVQRLVVQTLLVTGVLLVLQGCGEEKTEVLVASGKESIAKGDYKLATLQLKTALQRVPDSGEVRFLLGRALLEDGNVAQAEIELSRARDLRHSADEVMPLLLKSYVLLGQFNKAIDQGSKAAVLAPVALAAVQTYVGMGYAAKGDLVSAGKAVTEALARQPDFVPALLLKARIAASRQDLAGGSAIVDTVLAQSPGDVDALKLKGDLLFTQGKHVEAIGAYRKVVEIQPRHALAHLAMVQSLLSAARFEVASPQFQDAVKQLDAAKKLLGETPQIMSVEAQVAFVRQDYVGARAIVQKWLGITPDSWQALQLGGAVELKLGQFTLAEDYLLRAVQGSPESVATRRWLAMTYMSTGKATKALAVLEPVLGKIKQDPEMLVIAGEANMQAGKPAQAEGLFLAATKMQPNDPAIRTAFAVARFAKGEVDAALADLRDIASWDKGAVADKALIATYIRRKELDQALSAIDALIKKEPNSAYVYHLRGQTMLAKGDRGGARKDFERALQVSPAYYPGTAGLAELDLGDGKPDAALKRLEAAVAADPKGIDALLSMIQIKVASAAPAEEVIGLIGKAIARDPTAPGPRLAMINFHIANKDIRRAIAAGRDAVAAAPNRPELYDALGRAERQAGDTGQALATYAKMAAVQPGNPEPYFRIAELHVDNKDLEAAVRSLRKGLAINPDAVDARQALATLEFKSGKVQNAVEIAREAQKRNPRESLGYVLQGDIAAAARQWPAAIEAYRAGLKNAPSTGLIIKLHATLANSGRKDDAEAATVAWLKQYPNDLLVRQYLSEFALAQGDMGTAATHLRALVSAVPTNPFFLNNLANVAARLKQPDALELAERAYKLAPNQPAIQDTLGMLLADKGDLQQAVDLLGRAARGDPGQALIRLNYVRVLILAGKKADARREIDELVKLGDKFPARAEIANLQREL